MRQTQLPLRPFRRDSRLPPPIADQIFSMLFHRQMPRAHRRFAVIIGSLPRRLPLCLRPDGCFIITRFRQ